MGVAKTQCELQVASGVVLEAQQVTLSKLEESRSCRQQLEGVEEQLDLAVRRSLALKRRVLRLLFN